MEQKTKGSAAMAVAYVILFPPQKPSYTKAVSRALRGAN